MGILRQIVPQVLKWSTVSRAIGTGKFVICDTGENDPGAFIGSRCPGECPIACLKG